MDKLMQKLVKKKQNRFLYAIKNRNTSDRSSSISIGPISSNFALALTRTELVEDVRNIQGTIIEQEQNKMGMYQLNFDLKNSVKINEENALLYFPLSCLEIGGKIILVEDDFRKFMIEFKALLKSQDSQDQEFSDSNSNFMQFLSQNRSSQISPSHKSRNRARVNRSRRLQDQSNSSQDQYLQTDNKNNREKRGRGRPKGAKNKKKSLGDDVLNETNLTMLFSNLFSSKSIEQINNRLAKIREKQQFQANLTKKDDGQGKRGRGRPKGVRNKPKVNNDQSDSEDLASMQALPKRKPIKNVNQLKCCQRCSERITKKQFIDGKNVSLDDLTNLGLNLGVQNTTNVILNVINQQDLLAKILVRKDSISTEFVIPWEVNSKFQKSEYSVHTKKQYIVKDKRQGNYALVHDCYRNQPKWWKALTIDRILENIPNSPESIAIYKTLIQGDSEFQRLINMNVATLVRNGNQFLSAYLLQKIFNSDQNGGIYGFSKEHVLCLSKDITELHFRKVTLLKQNFTLNFCSPIHCAVINSNTELLNYIVSHVTDFNVGDSHSRKPIHYAVMMDNPTNLEIIMKHGADLKEIDKRKITPLMLAAKAGKVLNLKFILQKVRDQAYINFKGEDGLGAIHYAVIYRQMQCLSILIQEPMIDKNLQTKEGFNLLHLAAGTGSKQMVKLLVQKGVPCQPDNFRRTPLMIAVRNNHNDIFFQLFFSSVKYHRRDYSHNTLLHYAAAYGKFYFVIFIGNVQVIKYLLETKLNMQTPNKKNFYPYEIAVLKGHHQCARLLENWNLHYNQHLLIKILKNPRGTQQFFHMLEYLLETKKYDINYQLPNSYNFSALHYVCSISEQDYYRIRAKQTTYFEQKEFEMMQERIIGLLLKYGADPQLENQRGDKPVNLCIENENLIGMKLLMNKIPIQSISQNNSSHCSFIYYLTNLTCCGADETRFVLSKLKLVQERLLRQEIRTKDLNGFPFVVYLVKRFTETALNKFSKSYFQHYTDIEEEIENLETEQIQKMAIMKAFKDYVQHEDAFIDLINYLVDIGADPKQIVTAPKMQKDHENYKNWGIQHFLMKFPSPKLIKLFMKWIDTNFNMQNSEGRTPLHLFCKWNKDQNIFNPTQNRKIEGDLQNYPRIDFQQMAEYQGRKSLEYLLQKGLTSNVIDINRSTPLLYSAINGQIYFVNLLRTFGSSINNVNLMNQIPLIEIIKKKHKFTLEQIESIMSDQGAIPDFKDLNDRTALHHLVSNAKNFDNSPQICKLLLEYGVSVNSLDKFQRSPIFYCFIKIQGDQIHPLAQPPKLVAKKQTQNDKVQILQAFLNNQMVNLNIKDCYNRTPLHYACEKNFFFSILYLLDKEIDYDVTDNEGNTPLAICLKNRKLNQAALLIKKGVKYGHVVDQGVKHSYFTYAIQKLSVGICFMLIDHGYPLQKAFEQAPNETFKNILKKRYV